MGDTLEFFEQDEQAGFRLHRAEVFNWGTFHQKVWTLQARGENTLVTGDIGSGKSTLVDAITTLLVPSQKITFNKAAGAETRERNLRTYVLGHYKSERGDPGLSARAVALRDVRSYSMVLAHFRNAGYQTDVTLAQVFWFRDAGQPPTRFFVVADRPLSIAEDFADFGGDLNALRKRLRSQGAEIFDAFPAYGDAFRRRFGIDNPQALELFNQTVSMKSVGNLTEFVREHMLEPAGGPGRIEALVGHFDDLNRAHLAILKAKGQIDRLTPLVADLDRHGQVKDVLVALREDRDSLRPWFAQIKAGLLERRLENLARDADRLTQKRRGLEELRALHRTTRDDLRQSIADNGGDRLERLAAEIARVSQEGARRRERAQRYNATAQTLGLAAPEDSDTFVHHRSSLADRQSAWKDQQAELQNLRAEGEGTFRDLRKDHEALAAELESLRRRPSNIPREQVAFRERLCAEVGLKPDELPFVGELVMVRPGQEAWEGAAERVLRNFALSLLVPDDHYPAVAAWVDRTHLAGRLVYFRVRTGTEARRAEVQADSLVTKLVVKDDSPLAPWVAAQLAQRFDLVCCDDLERFRRERQALSLTGQTKGGDRHEKDDRHPIGDRTRYVLGWTNQAKVRALEGREKKLQADIADHGARLATVLSQLDQLQGSLQAAAVLEGFVDFTEIDWGSSAKAQATLEAERDALARANDQLAALRAHQEAVEAQLAGVDADLEALVRDEGIVIGKAEAARALLAETQALVATEGRGASFARLAEAHPALLGDHVLTVESCEGRERAFRDHLQAQIDAEESRLGRLRDKIIQAMTDFRATYPLETRELDVHLDAGDGYRDLLANLVGDDLPRFERQFKELLNENTIREVANFQSQLARDRQAIQERIALINRSLTQIDYNPGRFIRLEADPTTDREIKEFVQELRACTEGTLTGSADELYSEAKFLQVKKIIERFQGRPEFADADRRWTEKVTDVRQAFVFSASERWREDDQEHEHYTDSAGKSGGQKEKLAYTVLAASLAYQFGLEWGAVRSRTFRFVVIDEAFGRGSDESTRYALELFRRLNLQLLIVTPLQKISVIEPYVSSVGFVSNQDGQNSRLRNLTIQEYRTEKAARQGPPTP